MLGPTDRDESRRTRRARDSALVLLLLDRDARAPGDQADAAMPIAFKRPTGPSGQSAEHAPDEVAPADRGAAAGDADTRGTDAIAEIVADAERDIVAAGAERQARYQRAVDAASLPDALAVVGEAAADDDPEQAWSMLDDIVRRHPDAGPGELVTVAPDLLGPLGPTATQASTGLGQAASPSCRQRPPRPPLPWPE